MYKRDPEEVQVIDDFIREHYPQNGPDYCAEKLLLPRQYVQERAWKNKIRHTKKNAPKRMTAEERLRKENNKLRNELLRLKHEVYRLKNERNTT